MTSNDKEQPILVGYLQTRDQHEYGKGITHNTERRPVGKTEVWLDHDSIPSTPPATAPYPGNNIGVVTGIDSVLLTLMPGQTHVLYSSAGHFSNMIPANFGAGESHSGEYAPILLDSSVPAKVIPYDPSVWVADGYRKTIEFKYKTPEELGYTLPLYLRYWQYAGTYPCCPTDYVQYGLNVGTGAAVYKDTTLPAMRFRTLVGTNGITATQGVDTVTLSYTGWTGVDDLNLFVSQTGNDTTGTGAVGAPYLTLQRAMRDVRNLGYNNTCTITILSTGGTFVIPTGITSLDPGKNGTQKTRLLITGSARTVSNTMTVSTSFMQGQYGHLTIIATTSASPALQVGSYIQFTSGALSTYQPNPAIPAIQVAAVVTRVIAGNYFTVAWNGPVPVNGTTFTISRPSTAVSIAANSVLDCSGMPMIFRDLNIIPGTGTSNFRVMMSNSDITFTSVSFTPAANQQFVFSADTNSMISLGKNIYSSIPGSLENYNQGFTAGVACVASATNSGVSFSLAGDSIIYGSLFIGNTSNYLTFIDGNIIDATVIHMFRMSGITSYAPYIHNFAKIYAESAYTNNRFAIRLSGSKCANFGTIYMENNSTTYYGPEYAETGMILLEDSHVAYLSDIPIGIYNWQGYALLLKRSKFYPGTLDLGGGYGAGIYVKEGSYLEIPGSISITDSYSYGETAVKVYAASTIYAGTGINITGFAYGIQTLHDAYVRTPYINVAGGDPLYSGQYHYHSLYAQDTSLIDCDYLTSSNALSIALYAYSGTIRVWHSVSIVGPIDKYNYPIPVTSYPSSTGIQAVAGGRVDIGMSQDGGESNIEYFGNGINSGNYGRVTLWQTVIRYIWSRPIEIITGSLVSHGRMRCHEWKYDEWGYGIGAGNSEFFMLVGDAIEVVFRDEINLEYGSTYANYICGGIITAVRSKINTMNIFYNYPTDTMLELTERTELTMGTLNMYTIYYSGKRSCSVYMNNSSIRAADLNVIGKSSWIGITMEYYSSIFADNIYLQHNGGYNIVMTDKSKIKAHTITNYDDGYSVYYFVSMYSGSEIDTSNFTSSYSYCNYMIDMHDRSKFRASEMNMKYSHFPVIYCDNSEFEILSGNFQSGNGNTPSFGQYYMFHLFNGAKGRLFNFKASSSITHGQYETILVETGSELHLSSVNCSGVTDYRWGMSVRTGSNIKFSQGSVDVSSTSGSPNGVMIGTNPVVDWSTMDYSDWYVLSDVGNSPTETCWAQRR